MPSEMKFKRGDKVKLMPSYTGTPNESCPVWGGLFGYRVGTITKVITGDHNVTNHCAMVEWPDTRGMVALSGHKECNLELANKDEISFSEDWRAGIPVPDIFVLLRMNSNRMVLNVIETPINAMSPDNQKFSVSMTRHALATTATNNYLLIDALLSMPDMEEKLNCPNLLTAVRHITHKWFLPAFETINMPLPTYKTIKEAADTAPEVEGPAFTLFHLENRMAAIYAGPSE